MTSSMTPQINANWAHSPDRVAAAPLPMTLRVQAFEIIRTWLFYTLVKAHLHNDTIPWDHVMISGWGLNENGKKFSKRDLEAKQGRRLQQVRPRGRHRQVRRRRAAVLGRGQPPRPRPPLPRGRRQDRAASSC